MNPAQLLNPKAFAKNPAAKNKSQGQTQARPQAQDRQNGSPAVNIPTYDPAMLLGRNLAASKNRADPQPKNIQSQPPTPSVEESSTTSNFSNLVEKHHGVTKREAAPMRRNHDDADLGPDSPRKRAKFTGGVGKGGIIGDSVRELRQQGQDERGVPTSIVDLTEEDDELTVVSTRQIGPDPNREVCIGTIVTKMHAHRVPFVTNKALEGIKGRWPPCRVTYERVPGQVLAIDIIDRRGIRFGKLDFKESGPLAALLNGTKVHKMRLSPFLTDRPKKDGHIPGQPISEQMDIRIVVFCAFAASEGVRKSLSHKNIFLQFPTANTEGKEIVFPQIRNFGPTTQPIAPGRNGQTVNVSYYSRTVEEIKSDVQNIIDNLPNSEGLPFMEADKDVVETDLLPHQKQALYWLTTKETPQEDGEGSLWKSRAKKDGSDSWYNVISGTEVKKIPTSLGGLFSDDMGLGKTLSILSLAASTLEQAKAFGFSKPSASIMKEHPMIKQNSKATLIVCPKSVLSNWDEQITAHLDNDKVSFYSYHGSQREQDLAKLAKYDIIITSYSIIESEFRYRNNSNGKFSAMNKLSFFRVVLDEAHMIRNMTTGAFNACMALASSRRWAVTGTPVQNKLDDLGALIKFIRVAPFHEKGQWEMSFTSAWKSGNEQVIPNLKLLVSSTMLRRSKKKINIEDPDTRLVYLDFTDEERGLYEAFAKDSHNKMDAMTRDGKLGARGTAHMLTFITRLRLICAHGKDLLSDEDMKLLDGATIGTAIDLGDDDDDKPVMTDYQIYNFLIMMRDSNSNFCMFDGKEEIGKETEEPSEDDSSSDEREDDRPSRPSSDIIGYITPCYHVICPKHIDQYRNEIKQTLTADGYATCPSCSNYIRASFPPILRSGLEAEESRRAVVRSGPTSSFSKAKNTGGYTGPHTKVRALLASLQQNDADSADLLELGEPPIRSVVFSGWTQYLDLISLALHDANIPHLRLDGKMSVRARTAVLAQFRSDPSITVLLVSIKAGGQGLNLTAASRVYVMEPQFNPGVEMQAVDRVHRLGQTRKVQIVKFIMADSFEGRILKLQDQKLKLAREALGGREVGGEKSVRERMEGLRSLFR
ncbi:hypothetical protein K461DRAFT_239784 [Myriangium duriaei CBS 260.36]|uniref:Uncharacterized protein n=1 Tax=Myriangium duriaei CBS 260.36 TaxID=1168546 RepID=A0A9P4J8I6_9PEZI|nr:hypothetical protein K461DRAFT_239784 [Myriangium duriaei CBS 260.36]